ncbi:MAG: S-layer homology domain-containing protein [Deinococcales bacterium]
MAIISCRIQTAPSSFYDVPAGFYAEEAIRIAVSSGIIVGRTNGSFDGQAEFKPL